MEVRGSGYVDGDSGAAGSSKSKMASRLCYCTYGPQVCAHSNRTCVKHQNAACFHLMEEVQNPKTQSMETWHSFGCAPLEKGSDASHLTCNGWRSSHAKPKSIACCYEGDFCNKFIEPPPYANIPANERHDSGVIQYMWPMAMFWLFGIALVVALLLIAIWFLYRCRHYQKTGKWRWMPASDTTTHGSPYIGHADNVYIYNEQSKMLGMEASSGSGAGVAMLVQRTVGCNIQRVDWVGKGRYGEVWMGYLKASPVAVKIFYTTEEQSWRNECEVYKTNMLSHENILRFVAADIQGNQSITQMLLVTDYHELGSLHDYLRRPDQTLSSLEALQLAHSGISGIAHLHDGLKGSESGWKPEIAHRDIKSKNILVKRPGVCCIADFGLAVRYNRKENKLEPSNINIQVGTKRYMAPEVLDKTLNTRDFNSFKLADIYSYALVLWELARRVEDGAPLVSSQNVSLSDSSSIPTDPVAHSPSPSLSRSGLQSQRTEESSWALPYEPPFEGMVESDPTFDEMKKIVCEQKRRPPLEARWLQNQGTPLQQLADLMRECWSEKPECRHTALKLKTTLQKLVEANQVQYSQARPSLDLRLTQLPEHVIRMPRRHIDVESGFRSKTQS